MKHRMFAIGMAALVPATMVAQQPNSQCASQVLQVRDACQQAVDLFSYIAPQLGAAIAGGNATLGQGSTLGGLGHFSIGVRGNVVSATLPQVDKFNTSYTGIQKQMLPTKDNSLLPMPTADVALGIFGGFPLGLTNVLGVDVLANVSYIPTITQESNNSGGNTVSLATPGGSTKFGYGARVGILQESIIVPGVAVTYLKRDLPTVTVTGNSASGLAGGDANNNSLSISNLNVSTSAWRLTASKNFLIFGLVAGIGQDQYTQGASVTATVNPATNVPGGSATSTPIAMSQHVTRTNMFADIAFNLPLFKIVGEIGQVMGGNVTTYNSFANKDANASRLYASAGLRLSW